MLARLSKQRTALVLDQPFLGALSLRLKVVEDPTCETFWTDSVSLGFNPVYAAGLTDLQLRGALAHEVWHVANGHCWRRGDRDGRGWNEACDYVVNPLVLGAGMQLLPDGLIDARFAGRSAEEIYGMRRHEARQRAEQQARLAADEPADQSAKQGSSPCDEPETGPGDQPGPAPTCGEVRQYKGDDRAIHEAEWKVAVLQAAKVAKSRGTFGGGQEAAVEASVEAVVDWQALLWRFADTVAPTDFSFAAPNRRYLHLGLYLPSLHEPAVGVVVLVRDASGSVWDKTQARFAAEIVAICEKVRPRQLIVIDCDTRVTQVQVFDFGEPIVLLPVRGGGGTSFVAPFDYLDENGIAPALLVYLTDMDGTFPTKKPSYPVLWASTTPLRRARQAPFGDVIEVIC